MKQFDAPKSRGNLAQAALALVSSLILCTTLTGCLVVGYSSSGGWFLWPGSISLLIVIALIGWLIRR
jgi:hypothetical protein